jgi:CRISPR-associated protein Cas2
LNRYLIAYDVENRKRRFKIQKFVYSYAFGGQKSAVESMLNKKDIKNIARKLSILMDLEKDRVHIIKIKKFIFLRNAKDIDYDKGDIII